MKSKIILYCIVFKLALTPFKFDLMKKYEIRENLKDSTFPFLLHFKRCVFVQSIYLPLMSSMQVHFFYVCLVLRDIYLPLLSSMQVYFVLCLFSFEGHLSPTPQFYASLFCSMFVQSIYLPLLSSMQVYFVLCLFSFEGHLSPTPQFYASSFCSMFVQSIYLPLLSSMLVYFFSMFVVQSIYPPLLSSMQVYFFYVCCSVNLSPIPEFYARLFFSMFVQVFSQSISHF